MTNKGLKKINQGNKKTNQNKNPKLKASVHFVTISIVIRYGFTEKYRSENPLLFPRCVYVRNIKVVLL